MLESSSKMRPIVALANSFLVKFLPKNDEDSVVFYGTEKLYVFMRFYYTFYERILKAYELC